MKACVQSILAIFLILASYGNFKGRELDYSTTQIRKMWYVCSSVFRVNYPRIPEQLKIVLCDYNVYHLRENILQKRCLNSARKNLENLEQKLLRCARFLS